MLEDVFSEVNGTTYATVELIAWHESCLFDDMSALCDVRGIFRCFESLCGRSASGSRGVLGTNQSVSQGLGSEGRTNRNCEN